MKDVDKRRLRKQLLELMRLEVRENELLEHHRQIKSQIIATRSKITKTTKSIYGYTEKAPICLRVGEHTFKKWTNSYQYVHALPLDEEDL